MSALPARSVRESQVTLTELVLPNDTNQLGNLLGGRLMHWIDIAAAIAAQRHSGLVCVTASVDELVFLEPVKLGQVVTLQASVKRAFTTSMEVGVLGIIACHRISIAIQELVGNPEAQVKVNTEGLTCLAIGPENECFGRLTEPVCNNLGP